jgi:hypothetical protein
MYMISTKPNGFDCFINKFFFIQCKGDNIGLLQINANVKLNNWYIFMLRSIRNSPTVSSADLKIFELSSTVFSQTSQAAFFPGGMQNLSFSTINVGISNDN